MSLGLTLIFLEFFFTGGIAALTGGIFVGIGLTCVALLPIGGMFKAGLFAGTGILVAVVCWLALALVRRKSHQGLLLDKDAEGYTAASTDRLLVGARGLAASDLKPSGFVLLGGRRYHAISRGMYLKKGKDIVVEEGRGGSLVVSSFKQGVHLC